MKSQSTDVLQIEIYIEFEEEMSLCEEMSLSVTLCDCSGSRFQEP